MGSRRSHTPSTTRTDVARRRGFPERARHRTPSRTRDGARREADEQSFENLRFTPLRVARERVTCTYRDLTVPSPTGTYFNDRPHHHPSHQSRRPARAGDLRDGREGKARSGYAPRHKDRELHVGSPDPTPGSPGPSQRNRGFSVLAPSIFQHLASVSPTGSGAGLRSQFRLAD